MSVEASGGGGNNVGNEYRIPIDEQSSDQRSFSEEEHKQFHSLKKALEVIYSTDQLADAKPKIQRVPYKLRDNDKLKKYFEPKMFSFGPYTDYTDRTLEIKQIKMAKQIKVNLAAEFVHQNGVKKEDLYEYIKQRIKVLKDCYDDDLTKGYKDHKLAWMFLVDGCAILQFIYISVDSEADTQFKKLGIKTDYAEFLAQDLFLLENQLPYQLLQHITEHTSKQKELWESIYKFIYFLFRTSFEWYLNKDEILEDLKQDHVHLLDLLRKRLIQPLHQKDHKKLDCWTVVSLLPKSLIFFSFTIFCIIFCLTLYLSDKLKCNRNEFDLDGFPVPFHNIGKLREAGINLKCSKTICVRDISFSCSTLKLPRIILAESTARIFLNILGYEMCPSFQCESEVSTYMYFLCKLIVQIGDVEELREKNILLNELGSNEEVVKLFNGISTHLIPKLDTYSKVKKNIDKYFKNKGLIWLRQVCHDIHQYFKKRWSLLAFIGAFLAVASSIIQTGITVLAYQVDSKKGN